MRSDHGIVLTECIVPMTGPRIVARVGDHCGAQRIEIDAAMALQEIGIAGNEACHVAALPQRARAAMGVRLAHARCRELRTLA